MASKPAEGSAHPAFGTDPADRFRSSETSDAAEVLVRHLFAPTPYPIRDVDYAAIYRLAIGRSGGDIVDAFPLEDGSLSILVADISGKGTQASVQAALVKFSLRSFASAGMSPGESLRRLDRLYRETTRFEESNSFATIFAGAISPSRSHLTYASAGHEVVAIKRPGESASLLSVTGPAVGIFSDFFIEERRLELPASSLVVLATDGISESRHGDDFFGTEGFTATIDRCAHAAVGDLATSIAQAAAAFSDRDAHDDVAVLVARLFKD